MPYWVRRSEVAGPSTEEECSAEGAAGGGGGGAAALGGGVGVAAAGAGADAEIGVLATSCQSSPSSATRAISSPIFTVPSSGDLIILARTPSSSTSIDTTALSV